MCVGCHDIDDASEVPDDEIVDGATVLVVVVPRLMELLRYACVGWCT